MANNNPTKVITGKDTRWSYVNAWEPKAINGGTPKFSVSLIIPKSDTVIRGQADEVAVLRVLRQEKCAFFREVAGFDGQRATVARGAAFEKLGFDHLKSAVRIAQKNQTQNRHTVLIAGQRRTGAQQIGRGPEIVFEFLNIEPIGHDMSPRRIFQSV